MRPTLLARAADFLEAYAAEIATSYTVPPDFSDWAGAEDEKSDYDEMLALAAELRAAAGEDEDQVMVFK